MTRKLIDCVRHTDLTQSHHIAFWNLVEARLPEGFLANSGEGGSLWNAGPAAKPATAWRPLAIAIVREFEDCRLEAYPDPDSADGEPWLIGWGSAQIEGKPVRPGLVITQAQADAATCAELEEVWRGVVSALPMAAGLAAHQQAALASFAHNIRAKAFARSTLVKRIRDGENPSDVVKEELPRWNRGSVGVMPGLARRRAAEVALFLGGKKEAAPAPAQSSVLLKVPYEYQLDNGPTGYRECFSSSAAMLARFYGKVKSDKEYNKIRARFGDTTEAGAQVKALQSLGLKARFRLNGTAALLEQELAAGRPIVVGWLHHGPASRPTGGGHYSVVIGATKSAFIHNDPNGEADLVGGGYVNHTKGAGIAYSRKNWLPRWLPDGPASGWCITAER